MKRWILIPLLLYIGTITMKTQSTQEYQLLTPNNLSSATVIQTIPVTSTYGFGNELSADFQYLLTYDRITDGMTNIKVIETLTLSTMIEYSIEHENSLRGGDFSLDNQHVIVRDTDSIWLFNIPSGNLITQFDDINRHSQTNYAFTPDSNYLIFTSGELQDTNLVIYDLHEQVSTFIVDYAYSEQVLISPDGNTVLTASESTNETTVSIWQFELNAENFEIQSIVEVQNSDTIVENIAYTPDSQYALILLEDINTSLQTLVVWNVLEQSMQDAYEISEVAFMLNNYTNTVIYRDFSEDTFLFVDVISLEPFEAIVGLNNLIELHPNGEIVTSAVPEEVQFWNTLTGEQIWRLENINRAIFSDNGNYLWSLDSDVTEFSIWAVID